MTVAEMPEEKANCSAVIDHANGCPPVICAKPAVRPNCGSKAADIDGPTTAGIAARIMPCKKNVLTT